MSTITLIAAEVAWTNRTSQRFITEARVNRPPQPWGYMRYLGEGVWKVLAIFRREVHLVHGLSLEILFTLQDWGDCILLTNTHTLETAKTILSDAGFHIDTVRYDGLLKSG